MSFCLLYDHLFFGFNMKDLSLRLAVLLDVTEPVTVSVMLQNPLHISIPLHDVYLLWSFKEGSGAIAQLICNEMAQETTESPVQTQHLNSVMLKPDCIQEVCIFMHLPTYSILNMYWSFLFEVHKIKKNKLRGLSPLANYTHRAAAACRRSECQLLQISDATWSE
jgi:hypothetical protein